MDEAVCDFCGARSRLRDLYQPWPVGLRRKGQICPRCRVAPRKGRRLPGGKVLLVLGVFLAGWAAGGARLGAEWVVGGILLPVLITIGHEWAHAIAALLTGARVFEVRVGWHRPRLQVRLGPVRFTVARGLLRGGYCVAAYLRPHVGRWRFAVLYGTPLLLHVAAVVAIWPHVELPRSLPALGVEHFFLATNLLFLLAAARPFEHAVGAFKIPSDGRALLLLATHPAQAEEWRRLGFVLPAIYALLDGEREEALARARDAEHGFADDAAVGRALFTVYWALGYFAWALRWVHTYVQGVRQPAQLGERHLLALGAMQGRRFERWLYCVVCLHGEAWDAALKEIEDALATEPFEEARAMWLALKAYVLLLRAGPDDLVEARTAAQHAFELLPWVSFVCGTSAATLIESGRVREGLARLQHADRLDTGDHELAARNAWRAIALARAGRRARARRCLHEAQARGLEVGPPPALLRRAEAAVA